MTKMTFFEALDKQQLGIDCIEVANSFREGTPNYESNYKIGIALLTEVRDFMVEIKRTVGNFTVE